MFSIQGRQLGQVAYSEPDGRTDRQTPSPHINQAYVHNERGGEAEGNFFCWWTTVYCGSQRVCIMSFGGMPPGCLTTSRTQGASACMRGGGVCVCVWGVLLGRTELRRAADGGASVALGMRARWTHTHGCTQDALPAVRQPELPGRISINTNLTILPHLRPLCLRFTHLALLLWFACLLISTDDYAAHGCNFFSN